jgi:hypothetical protein
MTVPQFNGSNYNPSVDHARLSKQHERVRDCMLDGVWRTLEEIAALTGDPPASVSAQLRHLRKPRFGSYTIEKRARGDRASGLFEYRLEASQKEAQKVNSMKLYLPHTTLTVRRTYVQNNKEVENEILEGEVEMNQQQQDEYKMIIGDAQARVSVGRDLAEMDYGSGGKVFVSVSLTCDQSHQGIARAVQLAAYMADGFVAQHYQEMKSRCTQLGILKTPAPLNSPGNY